jgi:hypothetical protein
MAKNFSLRKFIHSPEGQEWFARQPLYDGFQGPKPRAIKVRHLLKNEDGTEQEIETLVEADK